MEMVLYNVVGSDFGKVKRSRAGGAETFARGERLAAIGKAVSGLAHDLKTPLIAIGGISRLFRKTSKKDGPSHKKTGHYC